MERYSVPDRVSSQHIGGRMIESLKQTVEALKGKGNPSPHLVGQHIKEMKNAFGKGKGNRADSG